MILLGVAALGTFLCLCGLMTLQDGNGDSINMIGQRIHHPDLERDVKEHVENNSNGEDLIHHNVGHHNDAAAEIELERQAEINAKNDEGRNGLKINNDERFSMELFRDLQTHHEGRPRQLDQTAPEYLEFVDWDPSTRLNRCQGDCDYDFHCQPGLVCFHHYPGQPVPGCIGGNFDDSYVDYCVSADDVRDPTPFPTFNPSIPPSPAPTTTMAPTVLPPANNFRLKLFWQEGYFWQEELFERKWCMQCLHQYYHDGQLWYYYGACTYGIKIYINICDDVHSQRFNFWPVHYEGQDGYDHTEVLIHLHGTDMCFQRYNRDIYLMPCNYLDQTHLWYAKNGTFFAENSAENKFEISQVGFDDFCITQRHHPKFAEEVELEPCEQARRGDTSYWNRY